MDFALYEYDPRFVLERFREGEFDFVDAQQAELVALTQRYRRFRKARARFLEVHAKMLAIIDKLEAARRKEP